MIGQILTAVPASVLVQLVNSSARSSIAGEFKAGNTPAWYQALPSDVKNYIVNVQVHATLVPTAAAAATGGNPDPTSTNNTPTTSTSTALASRQTAAVFASLSGVLGILGLGVAL